MCVGSRRTRTVFRTLKVLCLGGPQVQARPLESTPSPALPTNAKPQGNTSTAQATTAVTDSQTSLNNTRGDGLGGPSSGLGTQALVTRNSVGATRDLGTRVFFLSHAAHAHTRIVHHMHMHAHSFGRCSNGASAWLRHSRPSRSPSAMLQCQGRCHRHCRTHTPTCGKPAVNVD